MTTNTYQALCDDVLDLQPDCPPYCFNLGCIKEGCNNLRKNYPPQSAEQREYLLEALSKKFLVTIKMGVGIYLIEVISNCTDYADIYKKNCSCESYPKTIYALTHKLVQEGILSKEEVKEVLIWEN